MSEDTGRRHTDLDKQVVAAVVTALVLASTLFAYAGLGSIYTLLMGLGYFGAFISGLIGTSSLMISILPPQVVVFVLSEPSLGYNPLLIGLVAGIGAGVGQYAHYYIGEGGRYIIPKNYVERIDEWRPRIERYGALLIFLFAATPLSPDDLVWIPLGMMGYPKRKALAASIAGKVLMLVAFAYAGYFGMHAIRSWLHF
ncbi:VTT domain-containing protein [Candidatus Bathyarchaeota archaeon]|nr:VTT domain-containing protein [Candidatus Bathyarchaeota archaeon]